MEIVKDVLIVACGIFTREMEYLIEAEKIPFSVKFLDSSLHLYPDRLQKVMSEMILEELENFSFIILLYGDCHAYINDGYDEKRVVRLKGVNCCENILGEEEYRKLRNEGAFFVFHEWAYRWKEIFIENIGLSEKNAALFMQSMHSSILYIDTGIAEIPLEILNEMAEYFKLPFYIKKVELDFLANSIMKAYEGICG